MNNPETENQDFHHRKMRPAERWAILSSLTGVVVIAISSLWHVALTDQRAAEVPALVKRVTKLEQYDTSVSQIPKLVDRVTKLEETEAALLNQKYNDQVQFQTLLQGQRELSRKLDNRLPPPPRTASK